LINAQLIPHYSVHYGILIFKGRICIGADSTIKATYQRVKIIFHRPNIKKHVENFVAQCSVSQRAKAEHCHYHGLLAPLPIPDLAWTFISIDFIEGLPKSGNKNVILVVVDRLTEYSHFIALSHPYIVQAFAQLFIDHIFRFHGLPVVIVTDRDRIFTSKLWQDIFKSLKVSLQYTSAYHPQTDGQT
jgi:hypothetical protein